jgi:hypothetical protein
MARKRSLKDAAADQLVEKNNTVPAAPVAQTKKPAAKRNVVKAPQGPPAAEIPVEQAPLVEPAAEPSTAPEDKKQSRPWVEPPADPSTAPEDNKQSRPWVEPAAGPSTASEDNKQSRPCLKWIGIALLIGFVGGYFFGVGQAMGSANVAYLLIGSIGGYLFGRFSKTI